jgi:hypothetical protein
MSRKENRALHMPLLIDRHDHPVSDPVWSL